MKEIVKELFDSREGYAIICESHGFVNRAVCPKCQTTSPLFDDSDFFQEDDDDRRIEGCIECWKKDVRRPGL